MITIDDVVKDIMNYFVAIGAAADRRFSIRDFNANVMMNAYASKERDCLGLALASLTEAGVVHAVSPTEYLLTAKGLEAVRALRLARARTATSTNDFLPATP